MKVRFFLLFFVIFLSRMRFLSPGLIKIAFESNLPVKKPFIHRRLAFIGRLTGAGMLLAYDYAY
ncbi:MAG: hypothetical protein A2W10_02255 [Deltaproteobacteria bacterium RBG_16_55_12]|nr:MAG: hypothetical protein A2W10_02255 [Deltaproteobacteria bacterium RBG_16_55_12]